MTFKVAVLSIDGGGIKGIVPAMILAEIEKRTNKRIYELFDLIAGTSTGGILSLGLVKPNSNGTGAEFKAEELMNLYINDGIKIFQKNEDKFSHLIQDKFRTFLKLLNITIPIKELFSSKYTRREKIKIIKKLLGENTSISEALTEVIITSYATNIRIPFLFTSNSDKENLTSKNFREVCSGCTMYDAAIATSAAPTFFKPYYKNFVNRNKGGEYILIDGGVIANNPTSIAIVEAMKSYEIKMNGNKISLPEILVLSLGTGTAIRKFSREIEEWGLIKWVEPLINIVFSGQSEVIDYQMEYFLLKEQYYRFQLDYQKSAMTKRRDDSYLVAEEFSVNDDMDDASQENIENLKKATRKFIDEVDADLNCIRSGGAIVRKTPV